jgi:D-beta-D-heptose 7-phosphate kinase/D-beta-D-heptose 1-phosphate adenosyltransferase
MKDLLNKISKLRVLVIGDIMLDHYIIGDVARISPEAPVPIVAVECDKYTLGAAANVAFNLSKLGCNAEVIGVIGNDDSGKKVKNLLAKNSIAFDEQFEVSKISTIKKTRIVARGQQLCRIDRDGEKSYYGLNSERLLNEICKKIIAADAIILSDYGKGTLSGSNVPRFIDVARNENRFIAIDPKPSNRMQFYKISLMTPNRLEAAQLAGIDLGNYETFPADEICKKIDENFSPKNLVVTLGAEGMLVRGTENDGKIHRMPTYAKEVFDVSGAGDTSIACLTTALVAGESLIRAAKFANIAAGIVVSKHGTAAVSADELLNCENIGLLDS